MNGDDRDLIRDHSLWGDRRREFHAIAGQSPQDFPTRDEMVELNFGAIVATCRSVLNTSSPARTLGSFAVRWQIHGYALD